MFVGFACVVSVESEAVGVEVVSIEDVVMEDKSATGVGIEPGSVEGLAFVSIEGVGVEMDMFGPLAKSVTSRSAA